ncbi:topoisomerase DNA-binding C4 zinc finger domain-containing protein [Niveibacterium microcysteis]|uniref:topoisomerase DNA-binding C4 zinc finger domain-containing protein n=1 Tax=Niveibacterium microcysteis TaxID=2811415 RepID=UPI001FE24CDE|nr:topoisomerase DNA-binding C4 zinc finger domain-containing protein [Niveibacterium microcysteis]
MASEGVDKGFFMAPGRYTEEARAFAPANRITLLDGHQLLAMLQRLPAEVSRNLLVAATAGDWTTPSCPSCGKRMVARDGARGAHWGCVTFPKCRQTLGMREWKT